MTVATKIAVNKGALFSFAVKIPKGYCLSVVPEKGAIVKKQYFSTIFLPETVFTGKCIPWVTVKEVATDIVVTSNKKKGEDIFKIIFVRVQNL